MKIFFRSRLFHKESIINLWDVNIQIMSLLWKHKIFCVKCLTSYWYCWAKMSTTMLKNAYIEGEEVMIQRILSQLRHKGYFTTQLFQTLDMYYIIGMCFLKFEILKWNIFVSNLKYFIYKFITKWKTTRKFDLSFFSFD